MGTGIYKTMLKVAQAIMALLIMQNDVYHYVIVVDCVKMQVNENYYLYCRFIQYKYLNIVKEKVLN